MTRVGKIAKGIGAFVLLVALMVGIPYALWHFVGWPLPHQIPSWPGFAHDLGQRGIPDRTLVDALAVAVWLTWAVLMTSLVAEVPAAIGGRSARRFPLARAFQPLTGRLVATLLVAILAMSPRPTHASAASLGGIARGGGHQPVAALVLTDASAAVLTSSIPTVTTPHVQVTVDDALPTAAPAASNAAERTYVVQRGDTLWGIAERELGDPLRWSELYRLNAGRPQPGGRTLTDANWIDPGWTLVLPASPAPARAPVPSAPVSSVPASTPTTQTTTAPPVTTTPATTPAAPRPPVVPSAQSGNTPTGDANGGNVGAHGAPPTETGQGQADGHAVAHASYAESPVELTSGARIGGALVAGVLAALVALRYRRRQRYRPRTPRPGRRLDAPALTPAIRDLLVVRHASEEDNDAPSASVVERQPLTQIPDDESFATPDRIEVGTIGNGTGERTVELTLGEWPALVLAGAGAEATLRAWCAALVVRNGPYNVEIITTSALADLLLPGVELPGLRRTDDLAATCATLEREFIARTRTLDDADVVDAATYRSRFPADPFPFVVALAAEVPDELCGRWRAIAGAAGRLGNATIVAGEAGFDGTDDGSGATVVVDQRGSVSATRPDALAAQLAGARLFQLGAEEAADLLAPVAAVHNYAGPDDEVAPADRPPDDRSPEETGVVESEEEWPTPQTVFDAAPVIGTPTPTEETTAIAVDAPAPVRVQVLGPAHVEAFGEVVTSGLRQSAYELLAWFMLRPEGATIDAAAAALWPDATARRGRERFWTALGNLRTRLGRAPGTDDGPLEILAKVGEHYVPDAAVLDVDLWRFEAALVDAARAQGIPTTIEALSCAVAAYGGDLCPGTDYLWSEPVREDLHRRCLDTYLRLAELHEGEGDTEAAVAVLEAAITHDSICEEMHRRLITLLGRLGRYDAAFRIAALLKDRLAEMDLDSEPATDAVIVELRRRQERVASRQSRELPER